MKTVLQFAMMFVLLVVLQSIIFSKVAIFSVALAFVFIYFILRLPVTLGQGKVIALSWFIGFAVDVFTDTPGMNSLACTCLGAARPAVLRLYVTREEEISRPQPGIRSLGLAVYSKYVVTMSLLFCTMVFLIEALSFFNPGVMVLRIIASTLLTSALILAADSLSYRTT